MPYRASRRGGGSYLPIILLISVLVVPVIVGNLTNPVLPYFCPNTTGRAAAEGTVWNATQIKSANFGLSDFQIPQYKNFLILARSKDWKQLLILDRESCRSGWIQKSEVVVKGVPSGLEIFFIPEYRQP